MNDLMPNWLKPIVSKMIDEELHQKTLKKVLKRAKKQFNKPLNVWKPFINDEERLVLSR